MGEISQSDAYLAAQRLRVWSDLAVYEAKPNTDRYQRAKEDRDFADRLLRAARQ